MMIFSDLNGSSSSSARHLLHLFLFCTLLYTCIFIVDLCTAHLYMTAYIFVHLCVVHASCCQPAAMLPAAMLPGAALLLLLSCTIFVHLISQLVIFAGTCQMPDWRTLTYIAAYRWIWSIFFCYLFVHLFASWKRTWQWLMTWMASSFFFCTAFCMLHIAVIISVRWWRRGDGGGDGDVVVDDDVDDRDRWSESPLFTHTFYFAHFFFFWYSTNAWYTRADGRLTLQTYLCQYLYIFYIYMLYLLSFLYKWFYHIQSIF